VCRVKEDNGFKGAGFIKRMAGKSIYLIIASGNLTKET
jgi:hypothetical protein